MLSDALEVGRWVYQTYHHESAIVAVFMTHAIVNCNDSVRVSLEYNTRESNLCPVARATLPRKSSFPG